MKLKPMTQPRTLERLLVALLCLTLSSLAVAQTSPASKSSPAAAAKTTPPAKSSPATAATSPAAPSANTPATSATRTDVYHVHFVKAAPGKAVQLADELKKPDPKAPMPGHSLILRHQAGDGWDYVVIEHLGTKATVEAAGNPPPPGARDLRDWHNDTFVNGPSWADFTKAMGLGDDSSKSSGSVYVVSVYRPIPGHDDQLEKQLSEPPSRPSDTSAGEVLMQHLEGGPWRFLSISRYASWPDFATNESNQATQTARNQGGWFTLRDHVSFHNDTITDRIAP